MKIVCKLAREGGTKVTIGKSTHHFKADKDGLHVCEVADQKDINVLLAIPEAYFEYGNEPDEATDEDEDGDALDADAMNNNQLNAWAKERGFNPRNKKSITDHAQETYEVELQFDDSVSCATLIREVVMLDLEEAAQEG